jgi:hypothetical protein
MYKICLFEIVVIIIVFNVGLTWVFAIFAIGPASTVMQFLFCIFNSLQGLMIFLFLIVRERSVRQALRKCFGRCYRQASRISGSSGSKTPDNNRTSNTTPGGGKSGDQLLSEPARIVSGTESESHAMTSQTVADCDRLMTESTVA